MLKWIRSLRYREAGNSFIILLMLTPLLCGVVGMSMDFAYMNYVRTSLQESLDKATYEAARSAVVDGQGRSVVDASGVRRQYVGVVSDRSDAVGIKLSSEYMSSRSAHVNGLVGEPTLNMYYKSWNPSTTSRESSPVIRANVTESSKTFFLGIIGVDQINFKLESSSRIGYAVDNK